ncbi:hypothetical protein ACTMTI_42785 [Nonomuraea sp. H19]|uniref:hypothetical protein n=1 Tax=Nonomuraea sp. H19 TaxID=3452206 RepID=UPI003F8CA6F3
MISRRFASWNGLLATAHDLAVRAGWTGQDHTASWTLSARPSAVPSAQRMTATQLAWSALQRSRMGCTARR